MTILDKYILKQILVGFALVLISMTVLVWLTQSLRMIDMIVTKGVSVGVFVRMTILVLPNFMQILSPIALFAVTLFTFIRMQSDKEVMVMQAVGMSTGQIMRAPLILAGILAAAGYLFSIFVIPAANTDLRELQWKIRNDLSHLLLQEGQFNSFKNGLTLYVRERTPDGNVKGVFAYEAKGKGQNQVSILAAESGTVFQEPAGVRVVFNAGARHEYNPETKQFSILKFDKYTMSFADKNQSTGTRRADVRELSLRQLWAAEPTDAANMAQYRKHKVELAKRLLQPLYNFTFVFLAMFGILSGYYSRRGQAGRINFVVGAALIVQSLALAFENMAGKNLWFLILVFLNVWIPMVITGWALFRSRKKKRKAPKWFFWATILIIGAVSCPARALVALNDVSFDKDTPVDFEADRVSYNQAANEVEAYGNVVLRQNGTTVTTEEIRFNRNSNQIFAPNAVRMSMPDGTTAETEGVVLSGGMTDMSTGPMRARLYEGTRLAADRMKRTQDGNRVYLREATYTPCDTCGDEAPLWRLRAKNLKHDKAAQEIVFKHVFLDVKDVPVLYLPYLQMPDFTIKRKTGFLPPSLASGTEMKGGIELPLFVNVADNQNLTITPVVSPSHFPLLLADYQGIYDRGAFSLQVSGTRDKDDEHNQAHIKADFRYDMTDHWRMSGQLFRVATDTYFRKYRIPGIDDSQSFLTSDIKAERFGNRSYFKVQGYSFQSLQDNVDSKSIPVILPVMDYQYNTAPLTDFGMYAFTRVNAALINTRQHFKSNRLSVTQGISAPWVTPIGLSVRTTASVRADGYAVDTGRYAFADRRTEDNYTAGRIYPNVAVEMSYPMFSAGKRTMQVLEPIVMVVAAPNGGNNDKIPNVDSLVFDFDDTNLFSVNRFAGYDRVEPGTRVNYGVKWSLFSHQSNRSLSALFGQSYRFNDNAMMTELMGYNPHFSDYVGRVQIQNQYLALAYRFRLDQADFSMKKSEVSLSGGTDPLRLGIDYVYLNSYQISDNYYPTREEVVFYGSSKLTKSWSLSGYYRYDLSGDGGPIESGGALRYDNECLALVFELDKSFTRDRDYEGGTSFMLKVILKTLGGE